MGVKDLYMNRREFLAGTAALSTATALKPTSILAASDDYDIVILNGRVMDPESNLDSIRNIGISGGTIKAIETREVSGKKTIDAKNLVVAPGFIDPIAHGQDLENNRLQALDGVTTALQLESGASDVDAFYKEREGQRMLNYGCSAGHGHAREKVMGKDAEYGTPSEAQISAMAEHLERNLIQGAIACGFGIEYRPGASHWEILEMFRVAAKHGASCHVHTRYGTLLEPGSAVEGLQEVLANSAITGAPLHMVHVPSMALKHTPKLLQMIGEARARGMDVTADCYPYTAFGTGIGSAVFDPSWQERFGIDYPDLQWAATGERLTKETFEKYRKEGGLVLAHAMPEEAVRAAVASKLTCIGSDGSLEKGVGHPRTSGTFSKVLGHYVREEKALGLMDALRKMTLLTARRLEARAPMMRKKGRIKIGADADLTLFDPATIIDHSTYTEPAKTSTGVQFLSVNGVLTVDEGRLVEEARGGKAVRAKAGI